MNDLQKIGLAAATSPKGLWAQHSIMSLRLTPQEIYSLRALEKSGYIHIFDAAWGTSIQFTLKGVEQYEKQKNYLKEVNEVINRYNLC